MDRNKFRDNFFLFAKIGYLFVIMVISIFYLNVRTMKMSYFLLFSSMMFAGEVLYEILEHHRRYLFAMECLMLFVFCCLGFQQVIYFGPVVLLDFIILQDLPVSLCLVVWLIPLTLTKRLAGIELPFLCLISVFGGVLYYQEYAVLKQYKKNILENNDEKAKLKHDMEYEKEYHQNELKQSRLQYENQILIEKAEISQALHDKLGHCINGSLYQLEACKLILEKQPEDSKKILQAVIDSLRNSMDEIRLILRREKPSKRQMALIQLKTLCEECREKYQIDASMKIVGEENLVKESLWEIILDNAYEAVSNALKYADCSKLSVEIYILNEVVRCTVRDNGKGSSNIVPGMGIQGMKQRIRQVNGYLDIVSDHGFQINMLLPLNKNKE